MSGSGSGSSSIDEITVTADSTGWDTGSTGTSTTFTTTTSSTSGSGSGDGGDGEEEVTTGAEGSGSDIEVKTTADITNLNDEIKSTFDEIKSAWENNTNNLTPVITSGNDSTHSEGSLHFSDDAIDLRANNLTDTEAEEIVNELEAALGDDYDVIYENTNSANDHIHIEYDPD